MRIEGIRSLCETFGCSHQAVAEWQDQGLPVEHRGGPNESSIFDSVRVHEWLVQRAVARVSGGESARDRVFRLQGDQLELDVAERRGSLIAADQVEPAWRAAVVAAREMLLRSRRSLASLLEGAQDRKQREALIGQVHEDFLRRLSNWRKAGDEAEEEDAP